MIDRRRFLLGSILLAGCTPKDSTQTPVQSASTSTIAAKKTIKAGLVTDTGGVGDKSFNAQAWSGLQRAEKELGAKVKYTESKQNADYVPNLTKFAQAGYDVVFAVGFLMQDALKEVASKFPKVKFAIIDGDAPNEPNCVSYKFREEEGSFLVGALAASVSKSGVIGFVGGIESDLIKKFELGYQAGAWQINHNIQTRVAYVGSFDDIQKGQELALGQMSLQADIVYHAAGKAGIGVIKAAQSKGAGFYAIGVDKDQDDEAPGRVLTSMIKRVDIAVFEVCQKVASNNFSRDPIELGLKEDGIALSPMKNTKSEIKPEILAKIDDLKKQIIEGKLHPPNTQSNYEAFIAKKDEAAP
jgi:basic membrane protein A and related proteins